MAIQLINVGVNAGDGMGDLDRDGFIKHNNNVTELDLVKSDDNIIRYIESTDSTIGTAVANFNNVAGFVVTKNEIIRVRIATGEIYELIGKGKGSYGLGGIALAEGDFELTNIVKAQTRPTFYQFGYQFTTEDEVTWFSDINFDFESIGKKNFVFEGSFEIVQPNAPLGFSNLFQFDSLNGDVIGRKLSLVAMYKDEGNDNFSFYFILQETIDNTSFKQWAWNTLPQKSLTGRNFDVSMRIDVIDLSINDMNFIATVNGIDYNLFNSSGTSSGALLAEFVFISQAWPSTNFAKANRLNWSENLPSDIIWHRSKFGLLFKEDTLYFSGNPILKTALGYEVRLENAILIENKGNSIIQEETGKIFKLEQDSFNQNPPSITDVENRLIKQWQSYDRNEFNMKFIRKSLRNLYDEELLNSPYLTGVFLPEVNINIIAGNPPELIGALLNVISVVNKNTFFILNRATVKYRHRPSLLIDEIGVNGVAVDYLNGFPELIVEPQRTNTVKFSEPTAQENETDVNVTYGVFDNPFGFASWVTITPNTSSASNRWAGFIENNKFGKFSFYGSMLNREKFMLNSSALQASYEFIPVLGAVPSSNIEDYVIQQKKIDKKFNFIQSQRIPTSLLFHNGIWMNKNNAIFYPVVTSGWMVEVFDYFTKFTGSYIRTTGTSKTVDADVYTITNLVTDGLISATEGTIIERGSNQEVRTVWTGGNRLKFVDNSLVSTVAELPNDGAFTLDTNSYRLSEILIFKTAMLP